MSPIELRDIGVVKIPLRKMGKVTTKIGIDGDPFKCVDRAARVAFSANAAIFAHFFFFIQDRQLTSIDLM